jgi:hypothetical protein
VSYLLERNQTITSGTTDWVGGCQITLYPTPDNSTDVIGYTRIKRLWDWGAASSSPDVPWRYTDAYIFNLAHKLTFHYGTDTGRQREIRREADRTFDLMRGDDQEHGPARYGVDVSGYFQ